MMTASVHSVYQVSELLGLWIAMVFAALVGVRRIAKGSWVTLVASGACVFGLVLALRAFDLMGFSC